MESKSGFPNPKTDHESLKFTLWVDSSDQIQTKTISKLISLERKDYVLKYLGVLTDSNISWKYHISDVESKITSNIGVIARLTHFNPFITLLNRFRSLIFSIYSLRP